MIKKIKRPIAIGTLNNSLSEEKLYIDANSLMRHCLVIGSTGSGKTNTVFNLLLNMRKLEPNFPFLIIDPAKAEYRHLKNVVKDLEIYTAGKRINPLALNLFEVPEFFTSSQWVNELINIFENSFPVGELFKTMLLSALNSVYFVNGWTEKERGRTPTLRQFIDHAKLEISCLGYVRDVEEYKAMVNARFRTLTEGTRAITFDVNSSKPSIEELLTKPIIIELASLVRDDDKSIIFNTILRKLYHYLQHRGFSSTLKHLLVVEEAHRLLKYEPKHPDPYYQSGRVRTQEEFGDILSEIRTYGEGIIIVDQKPRHLVPSAITNTNLKICHKLPSLIQIEIFRDSMGLLNDHIPFVTKLRIGDCVLKVDEVDSPFFIRSDLVKTEDWGIESNISDKFLREKATLFPKVKSIDFRLEAKSEKEPLVMNLMIYQVTYEEDDGKEVVSNKPSKEEILSNPEIELVLYEKIKSSHFKLFICPNCKALTYSAPICPTCHEKLTKPKEYIVDQLEKSYKSNFLERHIELDRIYGLVRSYRHTSMPGQVSNELNRIREAYAKLKETIIDDLIK